MDYNFKDDPHIKEYKPFASGVVMPWNKLAIVLGVCCLGRNIEIKDLKFTDFERRKNREVDELLPILAEEKSTFLLAVLDITEDIHFDHQRNANSTLEDLGSPSV